MSNFDVSSIENMKNLIYVVSRDHFKGFKYDVTIWDINEDEEGTTRSITAEKFIFIFGNTSVKKQDFKEVEIRIFKNKGTLCYYNYAKEYLQCNTEFSPYKEYTNESKILQILDECLS